MANWYGTIGPVELPESRVWDPRGGWQIVKRYRGAIGSLDTLMTDYKADGVRFQYDPDQDGGYATLQVFFGAEETQDPTAPLTDTWSLVGNDMEKTLWTLPKVKTMMTAIAAVDPRDAALLRRWVELLAKGTYSDTDQNGASLQLTVEGVKGFATLVGGDPLIVEQMIRELSLGVESWLISQFALRHQLVIAKNYSLKPAYTYVDKVMTTESLQIYENVPSDLKFVLPVGYWLKRTPTVEQVASDKWQISQEWWHSDNYSPLIYDLIV
jgi:hypothetical protein